LILLGPHSHPSAPIDMTFCRAKRTLVFVDTAKFDLNRCNESPLRGEKPDFWPVSKFNTGSLPLRGILPVTRNTRSSADADNRLDAFSGQSRSTNMVPFHMLHIVSLCNSKFVFKTLRYSSSKNFMTLKWGQRSLKVIESDIIP